MKLPRPPRPLPALFAVALLSSACGPAPSVTAQSTPPYTRADSLRGSVTPERAWWDVTFYDLDLRVELTDSTIRGSVGIVYRIVDEPREMQIDLQPPLVVDSVIQGNRRLDVRRDSAVFWVTPVVPGAVGRGTGPGVDATGGADGGGGVASAAVGRIDTVTVHYHGRPRPAPNPPWDGGFVWARDSDGNPWVGTANQGLGASVWWPTKDIQSEEPDSQRIRIRVPDGLVEVSNGRLRSVLHHDDDTSTYEWFVRAPINNYNITVNAGTYTHQADVFHGEDGILTLDYWPLAENADAAREQFAQVPPILSCFETWFGPFPWYEDGFKLVETPYLGMEHQTAIAYGNRYMNGYLGNDLSGTGLGLEWDYIIVHEAAHEWWGNNITTADLADLWVHESFGTYAEGIYVECRSGEEDGARYIRGLRDQVQNAEPIIPEAYGVNAEGSGDMYMKGANMLHTIRQVVDDDDLWRGVLRGLNREFRHSIVTGDQVRRFVSEEVGTDLGPVFRQYLETARIPVLELRSGSRGVEYRWTDVVGGFDMPVDVRIGSEADDARSCTRIHPDGTWQTLTAADDPSEVRVDRDYYVGVRRLSSDGQATVVPPRADCG
ncbi:MAG: M1 family metallopeptidase [Longimicrobiales bacterium]|nr:M1 family metallopeptidase [Longimicrobiales bacterium]